MLRVLINQIKEYKKDSILTPVYTAGEVFMEILIPFIIALLIDKGIEAGDMQKVVIYGFIMLLFAFISLFFGVQAGKKAATASTGFAANLRESMFEKIQTYSFSNLDKFSTAGLVTRLTTDVTNLQNAFQMIIRIAVRAPLMMICSMIMCFSINVKLSFVFLIALVILAIALSLVMGKTLPIFKKVFDKYDALNSSIQENVTAIRVVKAFNREEFENQKFEKAADVLYKLFLKAEAILTLNNPVMMILIYGCMITLSWLGAHFIVAGDMTTGNLTSMFSYVMNMLMSLMMLSMVFVMVSMSMASARRIAEVLTENPELKETDKPIKRVESGKIDFDHVEFSYKTGSGEAALKDIDVHIKEGETIGIIGATGSGKSSFVNLISRLYDVTKGSIKIGDIDVRNYDMEELRNQVAVVLQKNILFSGTILDNLRWGNENATFEECKEACELACADEFIENFPDKYDTYIEQGGSNVSGGQKQRICIARALLKKPKILILDDSTSAVDTATDAKIREAFKTKIPGTTKIIISQRISSVMDADRIIVLDNGKISGCDSHEKLLQTNAIYKEINDIQMQNNGDFDEN